MPDTTAQKLKFSKIIPKIVAEESNVKLRTEKILPMVNCGTAKAIALIPNPAGKV